MVCVLVHFPLPDDGGPQVVLDAFLAAVPRFQARDGLLHKYFLADLDRRQGASVYLWQDRQAAVDFHNAAWRAHIQQKYGAPPVIEMLDCVLEIDNQAGQVVEHPWSEQP
ncbi:MAG TPA: hypothetical protein VGA52_11235 [Anaerolineales bacterium]|jgi:hypothetical protein